MQATHHRVVQLMNDARQRGYVTMILRRKNFLRAKIVQYPYDVVVKRNEDEGFGFVILSASNQYYGSTIGNELNF